MNNIFKSLISVDGTNGSAGAAHMASSLRNDRQHRYNVYRHPADISMHAHSHSLISTFARMGLAITFGLICWALFVGIALTLFS